jgi:hypothetical protein
MSINDFLSGLAGVVISLALLSYLIADNPVYRVASHFFIGVSAGYVTLLAWYAVLQPLLFGPLGAGVTGGKLAGNPRLLGILLAGLVGGLLLLLKTVRVARPLGTWVLALMVGVGAAVAVGGALTGTLIPQTVAAMGSLLPLDQGGRWPALALEALFTLIGTLATLGFFYYGGRAEPGSPVERPALVKPVAFVGQLFIGVAFGVMYAGALAASVAIFAQRLAEMGKVVAAWLPK